MAGMKAGRGVAGVAEFLRRDGGLQAWGAVGKVSRNRKHVVSYRS